METFNPAPEIGRPGSNERILWLVLLALAALLVIPVAVPCIARLQSQRAMSILPDRA